MDAGVDDIGLDRDPREGADRRVDFPEMLRGVMGSGLCCARSFLNAAIDVMNGLSHLMKRQQKMQHNKLQKFSHDSRSASVRSTYKAKNDAPTQI